MLLIITNKSDLACDYLILRLHELNINFKRLNTERYNDEYEVDIFVSNNEYNFKITFSDGVVISKENIKAVYFRQPILPDLKNNVELLHVEFANREVAELLRCLWRVIPIGKWLNHPKSLWLASNKIEQLHIAANLGFIIPNTCISACQKTIEEFINTNNGDVIGKAIKHGFYPVNDTVWFAATQEIPSNFTEEFHSYAKIPMIYQEKISKISDIRVTVVGSNVYATEIASRENSKTKIDWRLWDAYDIDLPHNPITLPENIADNCVKITYHHKLKYSAIDLIRTPEEDYIFLEMNPNGQWAWIEQLVNYPIRDAIIDTLGVLRYEKRK